MATFNNHHMNAQSIQQGEVFNQASHAPTQNANGTPFFLMSDIYRLAGEGRIEGRLADELCTLIRTGSEAVEPERRRSALARAKEIMRGAAPLGPLVNDLASMAGQGF